MASFLLVAFLLLHPAALFAAEAASSPDCTSIVTELSACTSALSSPNVAPSADCCDSLQPVLTNATKLSCLCSYLNNSDYSSVIQSALKLPSECKLSIVVSQDNCTSTISTGSAPSTPTPSSGSPTMDSNSAIAAFSSSSSPLFALFFFFITVAFLM